LKHFTDVGFLGEVKGFTNGGEPVPLGKFYSDDAEKRVNCYPIVVIVDG
jgi:hypothetical protein